MSTQASTVPTATKVRRWFLSPSNRRQELIGKTIIYLLLFAGAIVLMIPLFWMISTSVKPKDQIYSYPIVWIPPRDCLAELPLGLSKSPLWALLDQQRLLKRIRHYGQSIW